MQTTLSYDEQLLLYVFKEFFGVPYTGQSDSDIPEIRLSDGIAKEHLRAQKVAYLCSLCEIPIGDFNYSWDLRGPYSESLQMMIKNLDKKKELIKQFYERGASEQTNLDQNLLTEEQNYNLKRLCKNMNEFISDDNNCEKCELLGSLAYLATKVMTQDGFDQIRKELAKRKAYFRDEQLAKDAWKCLIKACVPIE